MSSGIMITAHSGCEDTPDNSIASVEKGIALGADGVEIDIRMDERGRLWLTHDQPAAFDGLTPLKDAFALIRDGGVAVNCDLKEYGALLPVIETADSCGIGPDKLIFSGAVDTALLEKDPGIARRSRIFLNSEELIRDMTKETPPDRPCQSAWLLDHCSAAADRLRALGAVALNLPYKYLSEDLFAALRARDVGLSLWTVNDESALRIFMAKDLLNVTTRRVSLALKVRASVS